MALLGRPSRRSMVVGVAALAVAGIPTLASADVPVSGLLPDQVTFYAPTGTAAASTGTNGSTGLHVALGVAGTVTAARATLDYTGARSGSTSLQAGHAAGVFTATLAGVGSGTLQLHAVAYDASGNELGEATETVSVAPAGVTITRPAHTDTALGVYRRKDKHWFASVSGTSTGAVAPVATDAAHPGAIAPSTTLPAPAGFFDPTTDEFDAPVDLTGYAPTSASPVPTEAVIQVGDGQSADAVETPLYSQTVTAVRASTSTVPGTSNVTITARVTDQYGQPVVGAPVRLAGHVAGISSPVDQLAVSDALGWVSFTGPTAAGTGYPAGGYLVYTDLNLNGVHGGGEPSFQVVQGTVSYAAPGKSLYHNDARIKNAGGVYADAAKGSRAARAHGFSWIDQDGQLAYATKAGQRVGRVSQASDVVWVNAHGNPFNPKWLKKGRFESHPWTKLRKHKGLRDAAATLRQDAALHLGVEWEVKDVHPLSKGATLDAAFANLASLARQYYGAGWAASVQIKVLSNLHGGQKYALKVLKHAHAHGFTTMFLARGRATSTQIPASAQRYVSYVRGAAGNEYPVIPPAAQFAPVRAVTPPSVPAVVPVTAARR